MIAWNYALIFYLLGERKFMKYIEAELNPDPV